MTTHRRCGITTQATDAGWIYPVRGDAGPVGLWFARLMCRWMAYSGDPILVEDLLFRPVHSLIDQSLHSRLGATTTNGDGFGIGWYGDGAEPAVFKSVDPAWNDQNLREIAAQIRTPVLFAHIRASTGTPVQRSNCHPFRHGRGCGCTTARSAGFHEIKRDLVMAVDPSLYPDIEGSTDSEALFFLALTFGLDDDPFAGGRARRWFRGEGRPPARRRISDPDDRGDDQRRVRLGVPLLQRRAESIPVLLHRRVGPAPAASRGRDASGPV